MGRKPNEIKQKEYRIDAVDETYIKQQFISGIFNNEYILVVGSGVILDREQFPNTGGDINQHIINEINQERRTNYKSFTEIYNSTPRNEIDSIYNLLANGYDFLVEEMSSELRNLIKTKLFRFVLTTTVDGYLETLLRNVWGDDLRIVNIDDTQSLNDFRKSYSASRVNEYTQPTLIYVFGKVIPGRSKQKTFVETDTDAIRYIEKWFRICNGQDDITLFLKSKKMLALGCKFDDWYFRFFWYIITRGFGLEGRNSNSYACDKLAAAFNFEEHSDKKLYNYLDNLNVRIHEDVWQFMKDIHTMLTSTSEDSPFRSLVLDKRREGEIFISYNSNDVMAASELFCKLTQYDNLQVWFDNVRLNGGDNYESEIRHAINHCKIFIPILSPSVAEVLKTRGKSIERFFIDEWRWASETNAVILPIAIDGYSLRSDEHKQFESFFTKPISGIDMQQKLSDYNINEKVGFSKLIESIHKHLGI